MFHVEQLRLPQELEWVKKSVFLPRLSFRLSFYKLAFINPPYITNVCGKTNFASFHDFVRIIVALQRPLRMTLHLHCFTLPFYWKSWFDHLWGNGKGELLPVVVVTASQHLLHLEEKGGAAGARERERKWVRVGQTHTRWSHVRGP